MKRVFSVFRRYFRRSSESGQSVILLAMGFIALAGFVGITTDISLMFVRYAQLSRAVDSAAVAAANQMRQDRSNATVQLAARQFIEFYGLSPESVIVDTCLTTLGDDPDLCTEDQAKLVRVRAYFRQPTVFLRLLNVAHFDMWVSATSQTAALDVVIVMDVSESMASQTSYSDWALTEKLSPIPGAPPVAVTNYGVIYRPPHVNEIAPRLLATGDGAENVANLFQIGLGNVSPGLLTSPQIKVNNYLTYYPMLTGVVGHDGDIDGNFSAPSQILKAAANNTDFSDGATVPANMVGTSNPAAYNGNPAFEVRYNDNFFTESRFPGKGYGINPSIHPRDECRVRFYPRSRNVGVSRFRGMRNDDNSFKSYYGLLLDSQLVTEGTVTKPFLGFDGFLPTYNYFGCCNDPDGKDGFDDLVCYPFKQIREATFGFLERIDFLRGDRAAFVTYNRSAFIVNPYPYKIDPLSPRDEGQRPGAMLDNKAAAYHTLKNLIGVNAEPYFYLMNDQESTNPNLPVQEWTGQVDGFLENGKQEEIDFTNVAYNPAVYDETVPEAVNYPVWDNCYVQNAMVDSPRTLFANGMANASLPAEFAPQPPPAAIPPAKPERPLDDHGYDPSWKNEFNGGGEQIIYDEVVNGVTTRKYRVDDVSYEYWAACRMGNVGAALREANNALLNPNTSRRFGTIWIIVLMSDGGAGASDPVRRSGERLREFDPYFPNMVGNTIASYGKRGEYGAFGLCPIGNPTPGGKPGELILYNNDTPPWRLNTTTNVVEPNTEYPGAVLPNCADEDPMSRHTCDFRPLLTLPGHPDSGKYGKAKINPIQDVNYRTPGEFYPAEGETAEDAPPAGADDVDTLNWNKLNNNLYDVDIAETQENFGVAPHDALPRGGCDPLYDVEDYARDWADYIAIANLGTSTGGNSQVPTIFTIGFALDFTVRRDFRTEFVTSPLTDHTKPVNDPVNADSAQTNFKTLCELNVDKCLGEQLLRYIADIGDNNRIDNDYYQDLMTEWYMLELRVKPGTELAQYYRDGFNGPNRIDFGPRDPCQVSDKAYFTAPTNKTYDLNENNVFEPDEITNEWGQLRANVSCGNYYFSPNADQLQFVFDDIASRMFTRLSR